MGSVVIQASDLHRAHLAAERSFRRGCYPQSVHDRYVRAYIEEAARLLLNREASQ